MLPRHQISDRIRKAAIATDLLCLALARWTQATTPEDMSPDDSTRLHTAVNELQTTAQILFKQAQEIEHDLPL
jgi:hypothetical protein